jgi:hypothetical protein
MKVKPHHLVALIIAAISAILLLVHIVGIAGRDAQYHAILKTYSHVLKPGMKRSEVENYFVMSKYVSFSRGASQDIVEIAHEKAGWVCQEQLVYLRFEFDGVEPNEPKSTDSLVRTSLDRSVCLDLP